MDKDSGRSPSGPGSRPSDRAASSGVSAVPASIPNAGTWHIVTDERGFSSIVWRDPAATEDLVADVYGDHEHLLAAAPDLYEAARIAAQAFRTLEEVAVANLEHDQARNFIRLGDQCRAALAKARGEAA